MNDLIAIVTPAYNVERYLAQTAESMLAQTHTHWQWIIVDDGSRDGTLAIAQAYAAKDPRVKAIAKPNSGTAETRNMGLTNLPADAKYIVFMDADDLYTPDALASLLQAAKEHPECIGVHGVAEYIDGTGKPLRPGDFSNYCRERIAVTGTQVAPVPAGEPTTMAALLMKAFHPPGVFLVRREVMEKVGPFDKETSPQEDWDYWLRAARHGGFYFLDKLILHYRKHDTNSSLNFKTSYRKAHYVRYKTFYSPENAPEHRDLMRRYYRAWQVHKIREKTPAIPAALKQLAIPRAAKMTAHIAAHWLLYLRGTPRPTN